MGMVYGVPQGVPVPYAGMPQQQPQQGVNVPPPQMNVPHTNTTAWLSSPPPQGGLQQSTAYGSLYQVPESAVYTSPPPQMMMPGQLQVQQLPQPQAPSGIMSPLQSAGFQSPNSDMLNSPPPTISPLHASLPPENSTTASAPATGMPMPMPSKDAESLSVGARMGPTVLFATAPGASEMNVAISGISGYPDSVSQQMQIVWNGEFGNNFRDFDRFQHQWVLKPTETPPGCPEKWQLFKDSAKVRFQCHNCGNAWTSMKGRVMFWIHLDEAEGLGGVLFKLYGQACQKCGTDEEPTFCPAMWYPEEVVKVMGNVFNMVGKLFYGFETPPLRTDGRQGRPKEHHNQKRCQACKEGVCKFERVFK